MEQKNGTGSQAWCANGALEIQGIACGECPRIPLLRGEGECARNRPWSYEEMLTLFMLLGQLHYLRAVFRNMERDSEEKNPRANGLGL